MSGAHEKRYYPPRLPELTADTGEKVARRAMIRERQLAALPQVPHRRISGFALAADVHDVRAAQLGRPTHNVATGKPLIDLSNAPSAMEEAMAGLRKS
jgi:hypothetical protein